VGKPVDVSRPKNEAAAQLKGVRANLVLVMTGGACTFATLGIVAAKNVQQVRRAQIRDAIRLTLRVDQQRKCDFGFFAKAACVVEIAEADDGKRSAFVAKCVFVIAQLRDVLAAENSSIVAKENNNRGLSLPKRAEANFPLVGIGQDDRRELLAERLFHDKTSLKSSRCAVKNLRLNSARP
jgi:hypothetical protein